MDPYKVLGISHSSSEVEIKKAYKKLAMETHPDKGGDEEHFKEINAAYSKLTNKDPVNIPEFSDIFQMFGLGSFQHIFSANNFTPRGPTVRTFLTITLEEYEKGGKFEVEYTRNIPTGKISNDVAETPFGTINISTPEEIEKSYTATIELPPCYDYRNIATFPDLAKADKVPSGNLEVCIKLKTHDTFEHVPGTKDLRCVMKITLKESLTGFKRDLKILNKEEPFLIDCESIVNPYDTKRIKGIGLNGEGDILLSFRIKFPVLLDTETRNIIKNLNID